jgi:hypothetical protein
MLFIRDVAEAFAVVISMGVVDRKRFSNSVRKAKRRESAVL